MESSQALVSPFQPSLRAWTRSRQTGSHCSYFWESVPSPLCLIPRLCPILLLRQKRGPRWNISNTSFGESNRRREWSRDGEVVGAPQPFGVVPSYHHHQLNSPLDTTWSEIHKKRAQKYSRNPTRMNAQEILFKALQLLETFMATSRCVYFKAFFPGLIPTCDDRKYSWKFLLHRRTMCKRWPKPESKHWLESSAEMPEVKLQLFSKSCYSFSALLVEWLQLQIT